MVLSPRRRGRDVVLLGTVLPLVVLAGCAGANQTTSVAHPQSTVERVGGNAPSPPALAPASASPGIAASPSPAGSYTVDMSDDLKYDPVSLTVPVGATVTWHNTSQEQHTVTADPAKVADKAHVTLPPGAPPFDSGNIDPGKSYTQTFTTPGTYQYVSLPHEAAGMVGTVVVRAQ